MAKNTARCVLTLPLITEPWQEHLIEKRFTIVEHLKNQLIAIELRKLKNLQRTKAYRELMGLIENTPKDERKSLYIQRSEMLENVGFSEYDFKDDMQSPQNPMQKHFSDHIGQKIAHNAASDVWRAFRQYLYGTGQEVRFHRHGSLKSIACPAGSCMNYKDGVLTWNGGRGCGKRQKMHISVRAPENDYEKDMLGYPVKMIRVIRKWSKSKYKYYLQLTLAGTAVRKDRIIGTGRVGIDIGTQTAAVSSGKEVILTELADQININHKKKLKLQRKMDKSRRAMNPERFNANGTYIRVPKGKRYRWKFSNHYKLLAGKVRELERKNADIRKYQHTLLANHILSLGDTIFIEAMNFSGLQRRAKKTKTDKNGRPAKKKRFGKSLANKAPAMFVHILKTKAALYHLTFCEVITAEFKASQLDHTTGEYLKCRLSERWKTLSNDDRVQRDLYSAFLLMNSSPSLDCSNLSLCQSSYPAFKVLHDRKIQSLKEERNRCPDKQYPSSFGI